MKNKLFRFALGAASLLVLVPSLRAQADYTATKNSRIQAGAGFMYLQPQYVNSNIEGISAWADYDFWKFLGAEVSVHLGNVITPADINENSYAVGPRFIYHRRKFTGYAKILFGRATISNTDLNTSSSYNIYSFGGGLEYKITRRINIRVVDFDYQQWPNFEPSTLTPLAVTIGASYIIR
jgi:hypothetical protein